MTKAWLILIIIALLLAAVVLFVLLRPSRTPEAEPSAPIQTESPLQTESPDPSPEPSQTEPPVSARLSPSRAQEIMACDTPFILLDVRELSEFEEGYIPGAVLMPLNTLGERAPLEILDKDTQIIVYCRSGRRSAEAVQLLLALGFRNVFDLGGILDWPYALQRPE